MSKNLSALFCGVVFGLGVCVSQMINPQKVLDFFDMFGAWDGSLAWVMIGALAVTGVTTRLIVQRTKPVFEPNFHLPTASCIDKPLLVGAALFGTGWGLSGLCPGPAISALSLGIPQVYVFIAAMLAGMWLFKILKVG